MDGPTDFFMQLAWAKLIRSESHAEAALPAYDYRVCGMQVQNATAAQRLTGQTTGLNNIDNNLMGGTTGKV